jgi:hypothetical protein
MWRLKTCQIWLATLAMSRWCANAVSPRAYAPCQKAVIRLRIIARWLLAPGIRLHLLVSCRTPPLIHLSLSAYPEILLQPAHPSASVCATWYPSYCLRSCPITWIKHRGVKQGVIRIKISFLRPSVWDLLIFCFFSCLFHCCTVGYRIYRTFKYD